MPLDPKVDEFLQQVRDSGAKAYEEMTPAEARHLELSSDSPCREPAAVAAVEHRFIPGPSADLPIRIYRPLEGDASAELQPALVFFHGSGWMVSNIETNDGFSRALANHTGAVVVAVNYQKAPEHKFPTPMDDCYAATCWVFEHAQKLGLDSRRIGVFGDSAGGNLAAAVALRARDENGPRLACQVLVYPAVQYGWDTPSAINHGEGYLLQRASMSYYWNHYLRSPVDGLHPYCSPLRASSHEDLPPTLIACAEYDPLCDDSRLYADKLAAAGVSVEYRLYEGVIHGFIKMLGVFDQADQYLQDTGPRIRALLA
ncbi:alpha/beta hydrolase [Ferrimonas sp. SCSIO 43195]|uniref:alpha/beta hydrolase n=1 Tax=Ferrimonas sp. SCSIO 43195 TaxID=2822844 RepID=UPI0020757FCF|nr:alpha/beta hydrolase [Ferrimonas sp. SCSIO 43195]USD38499.1 alpha/beta hydrolase [Ferrimonas sp. SCSIO 43195]